MMYTCLVTGNDSDRILWLRWCLPGFSKDAFFLVMFYFTGHVLVQLYHWMDPARGQAQCLFPHCCIPSTCDHIS